VADIEARKTAALKLSEILDDFLRAGENSRALRVVDALGATGSELAASKLAQLFDQTSDPDLENAIIEALGEVAHSA
jgi:hypothetical protein